MPPRRAPALLLALATCHSGEVPAPRPSATQPDAPTPAPPKAQPDAPAPPGAHDFGPWLGGSRPTSIPVPAHYAGSLRARQHRFITMEHDVSHRIDGGATLTLALDGTAHGCIWAKTTQRSSVGKHASKDGEYHTNEDTRESRTGVQGTWAAEPSGTAVIVTLRRFEYRNCELGVDARDAPEPLTLRCVALEPGAGLPIASVACRVESAHPQAEAVALLLGDTPRPGAWALRQDPTHRGAPQELAGVRPWLLLGAAPGLQIDLDDDRGGTPITARLVPGDVRAPVGVTPPG